jgi:uncharacterized protein (DUF433 family)
MTIDWSQCPAVESWYGELVLRGTHVFLAVVLENLGRGATADDILKWFARDGVTREQVVAVIDFPARIAAATEELDKQRNRRRHMCREFVKKKQGRWDHSDWLAFLAEVRRTVSGTTSDGEVGLELEAARYEFWEAYNDLRSKFQKQKRGSWNHSDWLEFLADVRKAGYGFLTDTEAGADLERDKTHYWNYWIRDVHAHDRQASLNEKLFSELVGIDFPRAIGFLDDFINANRYNHTMRALEILCASGEMSVLDRLRTLLDRLETGSFNTYRIGNDLDEFEQWLKKFYPNELTLLERVKRGRANLRSFRGFVNLS